MSKQSKKTLENPKFWTEGPLTKEQVGCVICLNILVEPVSFPCTHTICSVCYRQHIELASLYCPICRFRFSTWCRKAAKNATIVNSVFWNRIQEQFSEEIERRKFDGDDGKPFLSCSMNSSTERLDGHLASPGEIRQEFLDSLDKFQQEIENERKAEEEKSLQAIQQIQQEEAQNSTNATIGLASVISDSVELGGYFATPGEIHQEFLDSLEKIKEEKEKERKEEEEKSLEAIRQIQQEEAKTNSPTIRSRSFFSNSDEEFKCSVNSTMFRPNSSSSSVIPHNSGTDNESASTSISLRAGRTRSPEISLLEYMKEEQLKSQKLAKLQEERDRKLAISLQTSKPVQGRITDYFPRSTH